MSDRLRKGLAWLVAAMMVVPFLIIAVWAFADVWRAPALWPQEMGLRGFQYIAASNSLVGRAIWNSLVVGVGTTVLAVVVGWPAARALGRAGFGGKMPVLLFLAMPLLIPGYATGVGLTEWFLRLGLTDTLGGLVLAHLVYVLPYVILILAGAFGREVEDLEEAARTLGAGPVHRLSLVTVPAVAPTLGISALMGFVVSLSQYGTSLAIGGGIPMLPLVLLPFVPTDPQVAAALSLLFLVPAVIALVLVVRGARPSLDSAQVPEVRTAPEAPAIDWVRADLG